MLNLGCLIDGEDYNRLVPLSSVDSIPAASYIMTVTDGPESDMSTELNLYVIEFQPTADRPMPSDIKFVLEFSDEKRSSAHAGNELEKLEYIGTFLEKKYEKTKATFYLLDYKGIGSQEK